MVSIAQRKRDKAAQRVQALKTNEAHLVASDSAAKSRAVLRRGLSTLYSKLVQATTAPAIARRPNRPTAALHPKAPRIVTDDRLTLEQVWGQLSVIYAPVINAIRGSADRLAAAPSGGQSQEAAQVPAAMKRAKIAAVPVRLAEVGEGQLSSDDEEGIAAIRTKLGRDGSRKGSLGAARGGGNDDWRYALGKPGADEEDEEDDEAAPRDDDEDGEDDDGAFAEDDLDAEEDGAVDEEEADGDEEDSDKAALREMYGDDVSDDAELFDDEMAGLEDDSELEGEGAAEEDEEGHNDGDGDAAAGFASPFGPSAAPVNPLDFTDIEDDPSLSTFQKEELKRLRTTQDAEQRRVLGQHWTMQGEVGGSMRPRDALVDEPLDFDTALRPAPIITEHFTAKLEDRIKKRIADSNFDDVQRRMPQMTPADLEPSKRDADIDAQKSKLSLMDLYEKEFLEKQAIANANDQTAEPLTEVERDELKAVQMWKRLAQHLDALSNFFFTPKPVNPELDARVRATQQQAPAISIEAVGMAALAKDKLLAPQDVFRPKRHRLADVASTELVPAERRAIRRAAKDSAKAAAGRREYQQQSKPKRASAGKKKPGDAKQSKPAAATA